MRTADDAPAMPERSPISNVVVVLWAREPGDWPHLPALPLDRGAVRVGVAAPGTVDGLDARYDAAADVLAAIAADYPDRPLLLLRADLQLPPGFRDVFARALHDLDECRAIALPGNHRPELDPFAGMDTGALDRAALCHWCGEGWAVPIARPPADCLLIAPGHAAGRADAPALERAWLLDEGYVTDPRAGESTPGAAPHGHLRMRAQALLAAGEDALPAVDDRPVTLHVAHGWGGGVWQWIDDCAQADADGVHLVLVAVSDATGRRCGRYLQLCVNGPGRGVVRELALAPEIRAAVSTHEGYREHLDALVRRYGVGRIIVSSLIGHALDCLRSGVPTLVMLHDFFPLWPLLDRDPEPFIESAGGDPERARVEAMDAHPESQRFDVPDAAAWQRLGAAWLDAVRRPEVRLAAPTTHVGTRMRALAADPDLPVQVIPHGFRPFGESPPPMEPPADRRLHLVIPGRLIAGKGLRLLERALPALAGRVRLTAVGCGRDGLALMGRSGIDLIPQYRRDELPSLVAALRPHGALLLSTVPETWSYTLSEMRALGLAPIATRLGAFAERIADGRDGVLFDPRPDALVAAVEAWLERPRELAALAAAAPAERSLTDMARDIDAEVAAQSRSPEGFRAATAADATVSMLAARLAEADHARRSAGEAQARIAAELERRSRWAETMERQFRARTEWAKRLEATNREQAEALEGADRRYHELSDRHAELVERYRAMERQSAEQAEALERADRQYHELSDRYRELLARHDSLEDERRRLSGELAALRDEHAALQREQAALVERYEALDRERQRVLADRDTAVQQRDATLASLEQLQSEYDRIVTSRSWRLTRPLRFAGRVARHVRAQRGFNPLRWPRLLGRFIHHWRLRGLRRTLLMAQSGPAHRAEPAPVPASVALPEPGRDAVIEPVSLPACAEPLATIIVPVYNQLEYTAACLQSLAEVHCRTPFEVIVVDDASSDATADWLPGCDGVRFVRNDDNLGFIGSCNRGAAMARGRYLVFLNNDTRVTDDWLDRLIDPFSTDEPVGIVGARLVYADGTLQEAGGIVFRDGSGWNYGRGDHPDRPEYGFVSEADYVSGACLAIERATFESLGGFDPYFAPAYYEDTDLCFRARSRGLRVLYQPAARVIHYEGATSGTDEASGAKRYQAVNRERFRERWAEALSRHPENPGVFSRDAARAFRYRRFPRRALVIDAVTPAPDQDSGSVRMFAMLELLVDMGFRTRFMPENLAWTGRHSEALQQAGVEVLTAPWLHDPQEWLTRHGEDLDLVVVSRHYVLAPLVKLIRALCPNARLVFDTVDLHFLREQREAELAGSEAAARAAERTRRDELALIAEADATLVVSEYERKLLAELVPDATVTVVSNIHGVHGPGRPFEQREGLVFIGGFQHPPNLDAAEWLIDEILPRIRRELPDAELHIIGSKMPDSLRRRRAPGLRVHGFVADLQPYMTGCRVSVAPLRYGAGVKGKVNQAMSHGLPVVATTCAAEGMYAESGRDLLLADDAESFAAAVVRLYRDRALWQRLAEHGRINVETHFSVAAARRSLEALLERFDGATRSGRSKAAGLCPPP